MPGVRRWSGAAVTDIVLVFALSLLVAWPLGWYLARVFQGERTLLIKRRSHWGDR